MCIRLAIFTSCTARSSMLEFFKVAVIPYAVLRKVKGSWETLWGEGSAGVAVTIETDRSSIRGLACSPNRDSSEYSDYWKEKQLVVNLVQQEGAYQA